MKVKIYLLLKYIGLFHVLKFIMRNKLLIIAYHGFEIHDETSFVNDQLFIKRSTLEQRMRYLKENNFNVLSLSNALNSLKKGQRLPSNSIVITIDDGWYSTLSRADAVFSKFSYPYTIYISSYYSKKAIPVLGIVLQYILRSCPEDVIDLGQLDISELSGSYSLADESHRCQVSDKLLIYFDRLESTEQKIYFIKKIAEICKIDYSKIKAERFLSFLNMDEIRYLADKGVDIQLHTHRHMPFEQNEQNNGIEKEIGENIDYLSACVKNKLEHFCYPFGIYNQDCEMIFKNIGIVSAVTCNNGFVTRDSNFYYLPRFLDGESIPQIVFEAEVCGISEMFRKMRRMFSRLRF